VAATATTWAAENERDSTEQAAQAANRVHLQLTPSSGQLAQCMPNADVDINQAASMLSRLNKVDQPGNPYNPGDPNRNAILNGVRSNVVGLGKTGQVSAAGVQAITADIDTILPPNPI
jgi:hypothetical protein